ncbi:MAG TPA: C4-type zinc ribbon domain-containing protein [Polyangiaceae bacterium]|nr:C4-type zinc ribbon domain-containing protein [Polyangiaceae bacterium]
MTIQAQIEVLEALAAVDAELKELNDALTLERDLLRSKQSHLSGLDERFERNRKNVEEMERARNDLMGELRQTAAQVERSREKLSRCRTEREANAAQRELEELRKIYRDREQEVEKLEILISQGREESAQVATERGKLAGDLGANEGDVLGRLTASEKIAAEKTAAREALAKGVTPQIYRRYELIRKRKGTALAHTTTGTCSACHMQLPPMQFQKLLRGDEFDQCPSCNRILYFRPGTPGQVNDASENA